MRKILPVLSLILSLCVGSVAFAASLNGDYKGNPIVNVVINGVQLTKLDVPAFSYDGRTMLPLRACVEGVNGIVEWDAATQTAKVIKPETSIYFYTLSDDEKAVTWLGSTMPTVAPGKKLNSSVDIGGLPIGSYTLKYELTNQAGTVISSITDEKFEIAKANEIYTSLAAWDYIQFAAEIYKFNVYMKDSQGNYKLIATKTMDYSAQ